MESVVSLSFINVPDATPFNLVISLRLLLRFSMCYHFIMMFLIIDLFSMKFLRILHHGHTYYCTFLEKCQQTIFSNIYSTRPFFSFWNSLDMLSLITLSFASGFLILYIFFSATLTVFLFYFCFFLYKLVFARNQFCHVFHIQSPPCLKFSRPKKCVCGLVVVTFVVRITSSSS